MNVFSGHERLASFTYWLGAGGLIAFLSLAMGADRYWDYNRSIEAEKRHLGELARIAEENISGRIRALRLILDQVIEVVAVPPHGEDEISRKLRDLKDALPEIRQIFVTDERGIVTHMSLSGFKGFDASRRAYFIDAWNDPDPRKLHITGPVRAPTQEAPLILQSSRILMDKNGLRRGVIGAALEIDLFNEVMDSVRPIEMNGSAALIDKGGIVMAASSNVRHIIGRNIGPGSAAQTHADAGNPVSFHILSSPVDGIEKLVVARTLTQSNSSPLTFVTMSPMNRILERWKLQSIVSLAALIAASAAILLLTALLCRREAENRRRERVLAESESRLSHVIKGTNDGIWDWNIETGEDYLSPRWKEILGYRDDELPNVAASFFDRIHPDDKAMVEAAIRRHIETGEPYRVETRLRHKNGTYRWILSRGESVRNAAGKAIRMVGAITDVTEQKASEEKIRDFALTLERRIDERTRDLAAEKDRAESYLQIANTMIVSLGPTGEIRMINRKGCEILGRAEAELLGRDWFDTCIPKGQREEMRGVFAKILAGRIAIVESYENEILTADGKRRLILWHNSLLRDADGRIDGSLSAGEDITDRHRAEEALKVSEERFQTSQTFANIGTWDWNIVTGNLYWSERIGPLFGYDKRTIETTYENFLAAIHPDDRQRVIDAVSACVEKGAEYNIEHRVVRADGTVRWLSEKGDVLRDAIGRPLRMLGVVQDITDYKMTENHLRHAQKLESLGNLAGGVAHSLNNLLVPILALSKMTADGLPRNSPARAALDKVVEASTRAKDLVARVLAFSRQEAPRKVAVDLRAAVEDALRLAQSSVPSAIQLESEIPAQPIHVMADAPQIEAVILNLVVNAVAAIDGRADGRIAVRLGVRDIDAQTASRLSKFRGGPCAVLTVEDNGTGMTAATKERIFDPFFTTKKVGEGTGLGLSMAHGIVEEHGGAIEVDSEIGKGSTFRIHLPLTAAAQPTQKTS